MRHLGPRPGHLIQHLRWQMAGAGPAMTSLCDGEELALCVGEPRNVRHSRSDFVYRCAAA